MSPVLGDEFFLLGELELDAEQPARRALELEGLTAELVLEKIRARGDEAADQPDGLTYSPACYLLLGRAQGFAAALGEGPMTPEHVLLALLWDPVSTSSQLLWRLGVDRGRVLGRLGDLGVAVPSAALPAQREIEWGETVWLIATRSAASLTTSVCISHRIQHGASTTRTTEHGCGPRRPWSSGHWSTAPWAAHEGAIRSACRLFVMRAELAEIVQSAGGLGEHQHERSGLSGSCGRSWR